MPILSLSPDLNRLHKPSLPDRITRLSDANSLQYRSSLQYMSLTLIRHSVRIPHFRSCIRLAQDRPNKGR